MRSEAPSRGRARHEGADAGAEELRKHLGERFERWMLPERFEFIDEIPRTATGKFKKSVLRERFTGGDQLPRRSGLSTAPVPSPTDVVREVLRPQGAP